jgi:hypothetical protein
MPADPYPSIRRLIADTSLPNMYTAASLINRVRQEENPGTPLREVMVRVISEWRQKWDEMGKLAEDHMLSGRGCDGTCPFGTPPSETPCGAAAILEAIRALKEGRRLKQGPISEAEQAAFLKTLDTEDDIRGLFQLGNTRSWRPPRQMPLLFWRHNGNASAVAEAYRAGKVERPWDPKAPDGEAGLIADWVLLRLALVGRLAKWANILPQVRQRLGPYLRHRTIRKAQREARAAMGRLARRGLMRGNDQWSPGWCTPRGLELASCTIRPLWEALAGIAEASVRRP